MALQASAYAKISPSFEEPEILMQNTQPSGFVDTLADGQLRVRLAEDDLLVYMKQVNLRTRTAAGAAGFNELPGVDIAASMISTPTYLFQSRATFNHHDVAAGGRWGFSTVEAYRLGLRQGHFQLARDAALHGMNPQNGEGLLNTPGATALNLPPDANGQTSVLGYDNGDMAFFLAQQILGIKTRTLQLGIGKEFAILGPQRTLGLLEYNVVQLTQYQREGAGTASTRGTLDAILMKNGDKLTWGYDDTLQGAGYGGSDAVILVMPEISTPDGREVNTNEFAKMTPGSKVCATQYCDMAAPREILSPMAGGATDFLMEWRNSSGWGVRPQAIAIISMPYSNG